MDRWLLVVGVMSVVAASAGAAPPVAKPNIIVILADDFGFECVSANGGQSYKTPHLDRRAAGGVRFDHCRVQPLCTPTRVELMTGRSNVRNYLNFGTLVRTETTFAQLLKKAGHATGKWQLGKRRTRRSTSVSTRHTSGSIPAARRAKRAPA